MHIWEGLTALATLAMAVFSYCLWQSTDKLWKQTKDSVDALKANVEVSRDNVEALIQSERPHVLSTKVDMSGFYLDGAHALYPPDSYPLSALVEMRNFGDSPIWVQQVAIRFTILRELPSQPDYGVNIIKNLNFPLPPATSYQWTPIALERSTGTSLITDIERREVVDRSMILVIWGYLKYEDAFGRGRESGFGWQFEPGGIIVQAHWKQIESSAYWKYT